MKLKDGLFLKEMGDEFVVTAKSPDVFRGIIKLNKSGAFVFGLMNEGLSDDEIIAGMCEKYDVDSDTAKADYERFAEVFKKADLFED